MEFFVNLWGQIVAFVLQYVVDPFMKIGVRDVVDILALAFVLFAVYRFFRERRAARVLMGLVFLVIISAIVVALELPTLSYIVRLFASVTFFCAVVLFQPEFRDALESLGNMRILNPHRQSIPRKRLPYAKQVVEQTVDAVFKMADKKVGALIVFEGLTKLGDHLGAGQIIDAQVSSKLLRNIFYGHAPLHDGALIIRDMRIYAASCVLPSSNRNGIDFGLMGTRHRTAVGLTEVSDALVVVVSEQTGIVSVAQDGRLLRELDAETLTDILMTYIAGNAYLRHKKANLRSDYMEMLERIGRTSKSGAENAQDEGADENEQMKWQFAATDEESGVRKNAADPDAGDDNANL